MLILIACFVIQGWWQWKTDTFKTLHMNVYRTSIKSGSTINSSFIWWVQSSLHFSIECYIAYSLSVIMIVWGHGQEHSWNSVRTCHGGNINMSARFTTTMCHWVQWIGLWWGCFLNSLLLSQSWQWLCSHKLYMVWNGH